MARKEFSKATKALAFKRANGFCEGCGARLTTGKFHYDHHNPDGLTGEPTLENCKVLCLPCHAEKTKDDVERIAKAKRVEAIHIGAKRPKGQIRSRGFDKKPRPEKLPVPGPRPMFT